MTKILISTVLALFASLTVLGFYAYSLREDVATLAGSNKSLTAAVNRAILREQADRKVLVARQAQMALQARKLAETQRGLEKALQANKAWSDTDVPKDVRDAL